MADNMQYAFVIFVLHALSYQTATRFNSVCVCGGGGGGGGVVCVISVVSYT